MSKYKYWCQNKMYKEYDENGFFDLKERKCDYCDSKGLFIYEEKCEDGELKCPNGDEPIKLMGELTNNYRFTPMTKQEIKADRQKRSTEHFKKEIFPTLGADEQIHFSKKYSDLKTSISKKELNKIQDKKINRK